MKTMYIICGLPGSGKSTWAKRMVKSEGAIIISKDAIRTMIHGEYIFDNDREPIVGAILTAIVSGIKLNIDIIIDETNITQERRQRLVFLAHQYGYTPMIVYCKGNGKNLENRMTEPKGYTKEKWEEVINKMQEDFEPPVGNECSFITCGEIGKDE